MVRLVVIAQEQLHLLDCFHRPVSQTADPVSIQHLNLAYVQIDAKASVVNTGTAHFGSIFDCATWQNRCDM